MKSPTLCALLAWPLTMPFALPPAAQAQQAPASQPATAALPSPAEQFVGMLSAGDFDRACLTFDQTMRRALSAERLGALWQGLVDRNGIFREQHEARAQQIGQYDIRYVRCQFERGAVGLKVVYDPAGQVAGLFIVSAEIAGPVRPPPYTRHDLFDEQQVMVGQGVWALPGTLSLPKGRGPFAAVVLVHGSGPLDRDETVGPNKPFRDLAWGLASRGIAVLRYDKRTMAHPLAAALAVRSWTVKEEVIDDALAAVSLLRARVDIDRSRLFVLGHSLGAMLAPRIGAADQRIAGLIVMAGPTRPLEDAILEQTSYLANLDGLVTPEEQRQLEVAREAAQRIKALQAGETSSDLIAGAPPGYWLDLRSYDPGAAALNLSARILILQGGRDYQVTSADYQGWKSKLAGRNDVVFKWYPMLNHLFIAGEGKPTPEEYERPGDVAAEVIDDIATWVGAGPR